ncbi:MAG: class I SAM-dependent methyltransferase, partial [Planctomycetaceae bacterium]|nr:class I SAM-dependent methyltransferase [Planctomycetaceae bacterium]
METKHLTWDAEKVGDFWNWYSLSAERRSGYFGNTYAKQMAAIAKRFNRRSADILDFGCGTGEVMSALETSGFIVSGCDSSENSVLACKKKLQEQPGFRDCVVSNDTAPFAKGSFDCVIATETIEHLLEEWIDGCFHTW